MATPIENLADWRIHWAAADAAKARGECWDCQQRAGFAAVGAAHGRPALRFDCHRCAPPRRASHASSR